MQWDAVFAATAVVLGVGAGLLLAAVTLPGVWLMLLVAVGVKLWQPEMLSWWTIGVGLGLALLGEVIEAVASAVGARKFGASAWGAGGSIVGAIVGAVLGTFVPVPVVGTLVGAVVGAGLGALAAERLIKKRSIQEAGKAAAGAAIGRVVATAIKVAIAAAVGLMLVVGVLLAGV